MSCYEERELENKHAPDDVFFRFFKIAFIVVVAVSLIAKLLGAIF